LVFSNRIRDQHFQSSRRIPPSGGNFGLLSPRNVLAYSTRDTAKAIANARFDWAYRSPWGASIIVVELVGPDFAASADQLKVILAGVEMMLGYAVYLVVVIHDISFFFKLHQEEKKKPF